MLIKHLCFIVSYRKLFTNSTLAPTSRAKFDSNRHPDGISGMSFWLVAKCLLSGLYLMDFQQNEPSTRILNMKAFTELDKHSFLREEPGDALPVIIRLTLCESTY